MRPKITAICINKDFLLLNSVAAKPDRNNGKPRMEGINDVKDWLWLIMLTNTPNSIKSSPIIKVVLSAFWPKNLNSLFSITYAFSKYIQIYEPKLVTIVWIKNNIIYYYFEIPKNITFIATQPTCHEPDYPLSEKIISAYIEDGTIETGGIAKGIDDIEANDILALRDALE